jgi:acetyl esterase/lipase
MVVPELILRGIWPTPGRWWRMGAPTWRALVPLILAAVAAVAAGAVLAGPSNPKPSPAPIGPPRRYASSPVDTAHGARESFLLWPDGAPGAVGTEPLDRPKLTVYAAHEESVNGQPAANGAAVVVCPGGAYSTLASDHEGRQVAEWLNRLGVTAFVLQYRVGPRYAHPAPLQDAQRALRLVRARAADFGVDPTRVGVMGFSAGGHLAASAGTIADAGPPESDPALGAHGARPDFMILGYPVISMSAPFAHAGSVRHLLGETPAAGLAESLSLERRATPQTPPAFVFHTADDAAVPVENSLSFAQALKAAGVPVELHVFPKGRHGIGLARDDAVLSEWPRRAAAWLRALGVLEARPSTSTAASLDGWRYARPIHIDTSPGGADVAGDVRRFPLAVRLDASNFDFKQARADGSDLRFVRDGVALPHAIERWDAAGGQAAVWVLIDRVRGHDDTQAIEMRWGHPTAPDAGDSKAVFDTRDGFVGVWHLGEEGSTREGGYRDATANEAHGTGVGLDGAASAEGRVGRGVKLEHARGQWVRVDGDERRLFDLTTRGTFSIWGRADAYRNPGRVGSPRALPGYETLFAKGDNSWRIQKYGIRDWHTPKADLVEMCVEGSAPKADLCVVGKTDAAPGAWFHYVAVHDFPEARLYVDGVLEAVETFDLNWMSGDHPVGIGNQSQFPDRGRQWDGVLDEARALAVAKDGHWIRLDYESQREGSRLLVFGPVRETAAR